MNKDMNSFHTFLKMRNEELKREIKSNDELIKFMEDGGYLKEESE